MQGSQLPPSHYVLTAPQLRDRPFAAALYTAGQPLGLDYVETEPLGASACSDLLSVQSPGFCGAASLPTMVLVTSPLRRRYAVQSTGV